MIKWLKNAFVLNQFWFFWLLIIEFKCMYYIVIIQILNLLILNGNTLLEGVCIRLTWHLHNHDNDIWILNMK